MPLPRLPSLPGKITQIPYGIRVAALGITASFALIGLLTAFFRRRKKCPTPRKRRPSALREEWERTGRIPLANGPNCDLPYRSRSPSSIRTLLRQKSLSESMVSLGAASTSTTSTIIHPSVDTTDMASQQLCQMGLDTLQMAITYWEDAVMKLGYLDDETDPAVLAITDPATSALQHQLERLLEMAYHMQDSYERQAERAADQIVFDTALTAFAETEQYMRSRPQSIGSSSDLDSFVSATDLADLSDLDTHRDMFKHLVLYETGLMELKYGSVSCRTLRTEMAHCMSDTEFLAKLHCVRLGLEELFHTPDHRQYFTDVGRQIIGRLLIEADRDPEDFYSAYTTMMDFVNNADNWAMMEEELRGRGVKNFTFFDVVLDFILMDAFDDLEHPPSSVITVVQNRWLSNGFKETALSTAVWSVLKAKQRMLKFPNGFISHFYCISESVSPVLAWGFLGPDSKLKDLCNYFKGVVLGFIQDIFSFEKVRYTSIENLAQDIITLAKQRSEETLQRLQADPT